MGCGFVFPDNLPVLDEPDAGVSVPIFWLSSALGDTLVGRFEVRLRLPPPTVRTPPSEQSTPARAHAWEWG